MYDHVLGRRKPLVVKTVIRSHSSVLKGLFMVKLRGKNLIFELELNNISEGILIIHVCFISSPLAC